MSKLLYWIVTHLDLGPVGPKVLDFAVQSWLTGAKERQEPTVRRRTSGSLTTFHLRPTFGRDERM